MVVCFRIYAAGMMPSLRAVATAWSPLSLAPSAIAAARVAASPGGLGVSGRKRHTIDLDETHERVGMTIRYSARSACKSVTYFCLCEHSNTSCVFFGGKNVRTKTMSAKNASKTVCHFKYVPIRELLDPVEDSWVIFHHEHGIVPLGVIGISRPDDGIIWPEFDEQRCRLDAVLCRNLTPFQERVCMHNETKIMSAATGELSALNEANAYILSPISRPLSHTHPIR